MRRETLVPAAIFAALAAVPLLAAAGLPVGGALPLLLGRMMVFALAAMSLDLILGIGGLVSFGHAAPIVIGAYAVAICDAAGIHELLVIVPAACAAAALFAGLTGAVALRTRGVNFIMITLAFAQMVYFGAASLADFGGDDGYSLGHASRLLGLRVMSDRFFYVTALVTLFGAWLLLRAIAASRFGRVLAALRQNRQRVQALGFDAFRVELVAMVIAAMLAAAAGVLLANQAQFVSPAYGTWQRSADLIVMVILGGRGRLHGAMLGAALVIGAEEWLGSLTDHWPLIFGPALVLSVLFLRDGLAGAGGARG
ncbi:MAG: branched-chain amino acid ABC transporter permease [Rhodospirillales bacterium]|nr:branched-chain amino acid ABC transporter permease [Rhodospirillales bacterium]